LIKAGVVARSYCNMEEVLHIYYYSQITTAISLGMFRLSFLR
jgi:hypothetical protein